MKIIYENFIDTYNELDNIIKLFFKNKKCEIEFDINKFKYYLKVYDEKSKNVKEMKCPIYVKNTVVYGDTDSIMVKIEYSRDNVYKNRVDSFKLGEICADKLTNEIFNRAPIEMECENIYGQSIFLTPKRYAGTKYEDPKNPFKMSRMVIRGLATTRRNYSPFVRKGLEHIINTILINEKNLKINELLKECYEYYFNTIELISRYELDIDNLIITSNLAKHYKQENLPHVYLASKLRERKEMVQIGDRIPYVFIEDNVLVEKYELAEDPLYIKENKLKYSRGIYTEQWAKVVLGFFKHFVKMEDLQYLLEKTNNYLNTFRGPDLTYHGFSTKLKEKDFIIFND